MSRYWRARSLMALALLGASVPDVFAQKLLRDPFAHPKITAPPRVEATPPSAEEWKPELRAVMFDKAHSLVDIGGKILALGESVAGYRLIRIEERSATLSRDGHPITLKLDKEKTP